MNRRNFLKGCLAGLGVAAFPALAIPVVKPSLITAEDIRNAVALMDKAGCKPMIDGNYVGFCHPDVYNDIVSMGRRAGKTFSGQVGIMERVRFYPSSVQKIQKPEQNYLNLRSRW